MDTLLAIHKKITEQWLPPRERSPRWIVNPEELNRIPFHRGRKVVILGARCILISGSNPSNHTGEPSTDSIKNQDSTDSELVP